MFDWRAVLVTVRSVTWHSILVSLRPHYKRLDAWWQAHARLRARLKVIHDIFANAVFSVTSSIRLGVMEVMTEQIQSRDDLSHMSAPQIMDAWRTGRLDKLMTKRTGTQGHDDPKFRTWVGNGGQRRRR
jgi:hypothetical protein